MRLEEISLTIPHKLYHATFRPYLKNIKKLGLGGKKGRKNYSDSESNVVYLATDYDEAESYAEVSETVPEDYLDEIVVLEVDTAQLDKSKFRRDRNVQGGTTTYEYHGIISSEHFVEVRK